MTFEEGSVIIKGDAGERGAPVDYLIFGLFGRFVFWQNDSWSKFDVRERGRPEEVLLLLNNIRIMVFRAAKRR